MEQNQTREKIAWLAVLTVILMVSVGLFRLADATSAWLSEGDAVEEVAMNRPAPATNSVTLPAEMQQQMQQKARPNPGGWASGQFTFTPGPAQQKFEKEFENFQQQKAAPQQPEPQQQQQKKPEAGKPQYRSVDPNESMEEFWRPDYYDEGLDL